MSKKKGSQLNNFLYNVIVPVLILMKGAKFSEKYLDIVLDPIHVLVVALAFPIGFGVYEFLQQKKVNTISVIGLISVLLTGGIGLLKLDAEYIAIKEAAIPLVVAVIVLITNFTKKPLVKILLLNDDVIDMEKLNESLDEHNSHEAFDAKVKQSSYLLVLTLMLSSVLNYFVAKFIVTADAGTDLYNEQIGQMNLWGNLSIGLVSAIMLVGILLMLFGSVKKITGHSFEYYMRSK